MNILIVGFGHSGRDLHLPCIKKTLNKLNLATASNIYAYDLKFNDSSLPTDKSVKLLTSSDLLALENKHEIICHICTPPTEHLSALEHVAERGIKQIIMEKPMTTSINDVQKILALKLKYNLSILIVAPWLASDLTKSIKEILTNQSYGQLVEYKMIQNKSRFTRSLEIQNENIFFIEMPHEIGLALHLLGIKANLESVSTQPMVINEKKYLNDMGSCSLVLNHNNKYKSYLSSQLNSPVWERLLELRFETGHRVLGYYPVNKSDNYSQLFVHNKDGLIVDKKVYPDDVLTNCLIEFYTFFLKLNLSNVQPVSNLSFNKKIVDLLEQAIKRVANKEIQPSTAPKKKVQFTRNKHSMSKTRPYSNGVTHAS